MFARDFEFCVVPLLGDVSDEIHKFPKPDLIRIERIFAVNGVEKNTTDKEIVWICWHLPRSSQKGNKHAIRHLLTRFRETRRTGEEDWKRQRLGKDSKQSFWYRVQFQESVDKHIPHQLKSNTNQLWKLIYYIYSRVPCIFFMVFCGYESRLGILPSLFLFKVVMSTISSITFVPYQQHATPLLRSWPMPVWSLGVTQNVEVTVDMSRWLQWNTLKVLFLLFLQCAMMELWFDVDGCERVCKLCVFFLGEACWYDMLMLF